MLRDHRHSAAMEALGQSEAFLTFQERLSKVAKIQRPVLLLGERGTGKELAAMRLHYLSHRWQGPFVSLNCAALAPTLIESELFGYEAGAFTGALKRRAGRFETADGGSLFLDEIGSIPMEAQEKILRVVEYGSYERVGGSQPVSADVRIIGATNADLAERCRRGLFKRDLLDRLSFEVLFLPPLRRREGDTILLADHFARRMAFEIGWKQPPVFTPEAVRKLEGHSWPGNIRELKNVVERAVYRSEGSEIDEIVIDPFRSPYRHNAGAAEKPREKPPSPASTEAFLDLPFKTAVRRLEVRLLETALRRCRYNRKKAAALLGLTYDQLRGLLRKYRRELNDEAPEGPVDRDRRKRPGASK